MTASMTAEWARWTNARIKASREASEAAMTGAVADVLGNIEKNTRRRSMSCVLR